MTASCELPPEKLCCRCNVETLPFQTTAELNDLHESLGQLRALTALNFGVGMRHDGYNLYVMGSSGVGKQTMVRRVLEAHVSGTPPPPDWCYINNFKTPRNPRVLQLPNGTAAPLQRDMRRLVRDLLTALPGSFDNDEYRARVQEIHDEYKEREENEFAAVSAEAKQRQVMLLHTPAGYTLAPLRDGEVISAEAFEKLSDTEKQAIEQKTRELQDALRQVMQKMPAWRKEHDQRLRQLDEEVTRNVVNQHIADLEGRYRGLKEVVAFLGEVRDDVIENVDEFRQIGAEQKLPQDAVQRFAPLHRYSVNVLVDNGSSRGAPVIYEDHPTYQNLIGRIEHVPTFGSMMTDFTLIKAGALHRANGGYLILDARKVLTNPFAWDALKRALRAREIRIQLPEQMLSLVSTISLDPEPIPLDVKLVLTGERLLYYLLGEYDPEFSLLFKVEADFSEDIDRTADNTLLYARLIATLQRREKLRPIDRNAAARLIEYAARRAGDGEKMSLHMTGLLDVLRESDYWAREAPCDVIRAEHVERAIEARIHRADQVRERVHEAILRGVRLVDTAGSCVAQVNGLAVMQLGDYAFGHPSRITATARLGDGKVIDIEREVELGGAIHSKGVLILSSYLAYRFAQSQPLSLAASLVFEQSYGQVEGDSASVAELCALKSALAGLPLRQDLAVTGSVNQHGGVQAIGGVNEKIEGFFDVCRARGLSGTQGVIIPEANIKHLMLRGDVVEAAAQGRFHVHAVAHVDQAMEILAGGSAGSADASGEFPADSINGRVQARLRELSRLRRDFARRDDDGNNNNHDAPS